MLKKHPEGEGFRLIRKAAKRAGNLHPREATELETVSLGLLESLAFFIPLFWGTLPYKSSPRIPDDNVRDPLPDKQKLKVFSELRTQVSEFIQLLDKSKDTQWLAQYMVDEGASCCDVVQEMFKEYLDDCQATESQ